MKRIILIIIILAIVIVIGIYFLMNIYGKTIGEIENTEGIKDFSNLIKYKTDSINDSEKLDIILKNTELNKYVTKTEKNLDQGREHLIIYYDCTIKARATEYSREIQKNSVIEKNTVILFALINNLEKVTYNFSISNKEILKEDEHLMSLFKEDKVEEFNRETINVQYNQDVRKYINNSNEFLKYNIDTNIRDIILYVEEKDDGKYGQYKEIEVSDEKRIKIVKELIENQNFGISDYSINTWPDIWMDLNNGYIIGMYSGANDLCRVFKGTVKETIYTYGLISTSVPKSLPNGLHEYIMDIINL